MHIMNMVSGPLSGAESHLATRTCAQCKGSKKKCNKALPSCSRCSRLSLGCAYDEPPDVPDMGSGSEFKFDEILRRLDKIEKHIFQNGNQVAAEANGTIPLGITSASDETAKSSEMQNWQIKPGLLRPSYRAFLCTMDLMRFLEEKKTSLDQVRRKYLRTIHSWLPIVSEKRVLKGFERIQNGDPSAASTLLVFSMLLVISNPFDDEDGSSPTESHLYLTTKYQFSLFLSLSCPSIELVQAGILIALYEHAQGATDMAYVTIGTCARLAYLLGLHRAVPCPSITTEEIQSRVEEENRTWWAIVVVDRYINMEPLAPPRPAAVENPTPEETLPQQYQPWPSTFPAIQSSPLSSGNSEGDWDYALEANAARKLGQVQDLIRENYSDETIRMEKAFQIYNELEEMLIHIRRRHNISLYNRYGGGFATGIGAALTLLLSFRQDSGGATGDDVCTLKLQELCHAMVVICNDLEEVTFNPSLSLDSIPPSVISAIYYAALGQKVIRQMDLSADVEDWEGSIFIKSLRALSTRWMLAKRYLEILQSDEKK